MYPGKMTMSIILVLMLLASGLVFVDADQAEEINAIGSGAPTRTIVQETENNNDWSNTNLLPTTAGSRYELHGNLSSSSDFDYFRLDLTGGSGPVDKIDVRPIWVDTDYQDQAFVAWIWSFYPQNTLPPSQSDQISSAVQIWTEMYYFWSTLSFTASYSGIYGMIVRPASTLSGPLSYNLTVTITSVTPKDSNNDRESSFGITSLQRTFTDSMDTSSDQFDTFHLDAPNPIHPTTLELDYSITSSNPSYLSGSYEFGTEVDIFVYYNSRALPDRFDLQKFRVSGEKNFQNDGCLPSPAKIRMNKNCTEMFVVMFVRTFGLDTAGNRQYSANVGSVSYRADFNIIPEIPNNMPILKNPSASPMRGMSNQTFFFRVDYYDANNETPEQIWLWLDDHPFRELSPIDGGTVHDYSTGVRYGIDIPGTILGKDAQHKVNFSASDGEDWALHELMAMDPIYVIVDDNLPPLSTFGSTYNVEMDEDGEAEEVDLDTLFTDPDPTTEFTYAIVVSDGQPVTRYENDFFISRIIETTNQGGQNLLSFTPKENVHGTFTVRINATDDGQFPKYAEVDIVFDVLPVNDPPQIVRVGRLSVDEGETSLSFNDGEQGQKFDLDMIARDEDGDSLTYNWNIDEVLSDPLPGINYFTNQTSGEMWFIPGDDDLPMMDLLLWVEDDEGGTAEIEVSIEISNINDPPKITVPDSRSTIEGEYLYINPTAVDPDLDSGDQLIFGYDLGLLALKAPPNAIEFDPQTGRLVINAMEEEMNGEYDITITVSDLALEFDSAVCRITIQNVNDPPVAENVYYDVTEGNLTVIFNTNEAFDEDGDELIYIWNFGDGSPSFQGKGMRNVQHEYVQGGSYTVTMKVYDGKDYSEEVTVLLSVKPPDPDPDQDNDGMEDIWELRFGLDPTDPSDADMDPDSDGLTNLEEFQLFRDLGWDLNPRNPDTDEDGWEDGEEVSRSYDPTDPGDHPEEKYAGIPTILYLAFLFVIILALLFVIVFFVIRRRNRPKAIASQAPLYPAATYDQSLQGGGYPMVQGADYQQLPPAQIEQVDQYVDQYQQYPDQGQFQYYPADQLQDSYSEDQNYEGVQQVDGPDQYPQQEIPDENYTDNQAQSYPESDGQLDTYPTTDRGTGEELSPSVEIPEEQELPVPGPDEPIPGNEAPEVHGVPEGPEEVKVPDPVSRIPRPPDLPDL